MAKRKAHYILSTHWDREWYQPFQVYRHRLVQMVDRVLDGLDSRELKGPFTTDGQSIVIDDYLEVRPEYRERVERHVRDRKIVMGPWYVLPDEYLVSGESHVRNIRIGREIARRYGAAPSQAGFVCDLFGHVSQLPQIFHGFGIETALTWRGILDDGKRHFIWSGADGSELVGYRFPHVGYGDFSAKVREAYVLPEPRDPKKVAKLLEDFIEAEGKATTIDSILLFDGCDHQEWDRETYTVLSERMKKAVGDVEVVHSDLDTYCAEMLAQKKKIKRRVEGELREPGKTPEKDSHQIHGVLSSRVWIKQANAECEQKLCLWAEPFKHFSETATPRKSAPGFLDFAWRTLIQNHPHDSICGCSVDTVHEDMKYRFSQVRQVADHLTLESLRTLSASVEGEIAEDELRLSLFNPLPVEHDGTVEVEVMLPEGWPIFQEFFGFEPKPAFWILDEKGKKVPYQRLEQAANQNCTRFDWTRFPKSWKATRVRVSIDARIPAMGYRTFKVVRGQEFHPTRFPAVPTLVASESGLENEIVSVRVNANGSLTMTDKRTGEVYENLLLFEDRADIGDGWFHGEAVNDQIHASTAASAEVGVIENGPNVGALRIRTTMRVPARFDFRTMKRSEERVDLVIDSVVRLRPRQAHLEIETTVHNNADDHRVRVLFHSGAKGAKTFLTDSVFDVVERPITLRKDNHEYHEMEVESKPQQTWSAVWDKKRGLAVASTGLYETAVRDQETRPVALTLFRGTGRTVHTNGEPGGQLRGELLFRYAVMPLAGAPDVTKLFHLGQRVAVGLRHQQMDRWDQRIYLPGKGVALPPSAGFLEVSGPAVLTSARDVNGAFEVRVFNPTAKVAKCTISWKDRPRKAPSYKKAQRVNLESEPVKGGKLEVASSAVTVNLKPKEIATISLS